ncbi:MAG: BtrH N-terminal domain-containing protein [Chloroflexi bacterium]|nr:BtrH N-terminal domain-containing protein [Chloroflexota bacterium]MCC6892660.1 DUF4872 domain-containing protein [Anaerolineae bacterium]
MPILKNYHQFDGLQQETGAIHNVLAYGGQPAPHTGKPLSEALLMGISGGIAVGYFLFEYQGYLPHVALLTRNTFDPLETLFERLALPREVLQTSKPNIAYENLIATLESGHPAVVWADAFSLPYNLLPSDERMWGTVPIVVYGVEGDTVYIADRSPQPRTVTTDELMTARGRVKDDKSRILVLDAPDMDKLPAAVLKGIWQCISLFTDAPPKGKRTNFGFAALEHWADMLVNTRNKHSWERYFTPGSRLYNGIAGDIGQPGVFDWITWWNGSDGAERGMYADFLDEAALLLGKPALKAVGEQFRQSAKAWNALAEAVLPDTIPLLKETRELKQRNRRLIKQGMSTLEERKAIVARLKALKAAAATEFNLSAGDYTAFRETLRDHILTIADLEKAAVAALQAAVI